MTSRARYAEVAVAVKAIRRAFTYAVPSHLQDQAEVGKRALVPLGRRLVTGYIVGLSEEADFPQVKELQEILDAQPILDEHLLALTRWLADHYLSPLGLAIRVALPPGIDTYTKPFLVFKGAPPFERLRGLPFPARELLALLQEEERLPLSRVKRRYNTPEVETVIRGLQKDGIIAVEAILIPPRVKPKWERFVVPLQVKETLAEAAVDLERKAPGQAKLLQELVREGGPLKAAEAKAIAGSSALHGLLTKGLVALERREVVRDPFRGPTLTTPDPPTLTTHQEEALKIIQRGMDEEGFSPALLFGITGSGKTEVYLKVIEEVLRRGKQALVLVPEIALTPLALARFRARFGDTVAALHSGLSPGERLDQWMRVRRGEAEVVVGTRSAVFAPFSRLGVIVVDEEHDTSYKQDDEPRYHARDVALERAKRLRIPILLGSATPSFESFHAAEGGRYQLLTLPERVEQRRLPEVKLLDLKAERTERVPILAQGLLRLIEECMRRREQVLLFLNRRGYATLILCRACGETLGCPHCSVSLTYHAQSRRLRCHYCRFERRPPATCPRCGGVKLSALGFGTQQVEEAVKTHFPEARVARMDRDTTQGKDAHRRLLKALEQGEIDILVGTQMIGKGHDFPRITLVGVVSADLSLQIPDFRAAERTYALLTQVSGRAGRGGLPGEALIQTYNPDHYCLQAACRQDYEALYRTELPLRAERSFPPFSSLIRLLAISPLEVEAKRMAEELSRFLRQQEGLQVDGPAPALLSRIKGRFRWQILLKGEQETIRRAALEALQKLPPSSRSKKALVEVDVDPVEFL
ncbi:MAG: primosomal protein N' [candidate division NC10 bacterium]|nr:primosomal protein N' [candidate division NC10 bacterium]